MLWCALERSTHDVRVDAPCRAFAVPDGDRRRAVRRYRVASGENPIHVSHHRGLHFDNTIVHHHVVGPIEQRQVSVLTECQQE